MSEIGLFSVFMEFIFCWGRLILNLYVFLGVITN